MDIAICVCVCVVCVCVCVLIESCFTQLALSTGTYRQAPINIVLLVGLFSGLLYFKVVCLVYPVVVFMHGVLGNDIRRIDHQLHF